MISITAGSGNFLFGTNLSEVYVKSSKSPKHWLIYLRRYIIAISSFCLRSLLSATPAPAPHNAATVPPATAAAFIATSGLLAIYCIAPVGITPPFNSFRFLLLDFLRFSSRFLSLRFLSLRFSSRFPSRFSSRFPSRFSSRFPSPPSHCCRHDHFT